MIRTHIKDDTFYIMTKTKYGPDRSVTTLLVKNDLIQKAKQAGYTIIDGDAVELLTERKRKIDSLK